MKLFSGFCSSSTLPRHNIKTSYILQYIILDKWALFEYIWFLTFVPFTKKIFFLSLDEVNGQNQNTRKELL